MSGIEVLGVALVAAAVAAVLLQWKNGRFSARPASEDRPRLSAAELGAPLGDRATLVQFSSSFCAPCRATRQVLTQVVDLVPGVTTVEIDAESQLELVRRLDVLRTPTVLVLDAQGAIVTRASGAPTRDQVLVALEAAVVR
ncbi:thioredoxin family protein [Aeromicrobium sp.]|uniref:TlpA family protein disulfide reductase n=1 Tax=Aeromicrobium sp. TaxID=1871063 RepID=UPI0028B0748D|nr:thioredoxin family protein [Aeromicrobium sp.]